MDHLSELDDAPKNRLKQCILLFSCHNICNIFILLSMIITGIVVVCLKAPKIDNNVCHMMFLKTDIDPADFTANPVSIAIGDLNEDQQLDLIVANSHTNTIQLLFGDGEGAFINKTDILVGTGANLSSITLGYLNEDKHLDIAVASFGMHQIDLFYGTGDGKFVHNRSLSTHTGRPLWLIVNDVNGDNRSDIIVVNDGTHHISIYYALGDGQFSSPSFFFTGYDSLPRAVVAVDLNNDDRVDLVVVNEGTNTVGVFIQRNNSTFSDQMIHTTGLNSKPNAIGAGDFNKDGYQDIVVTTLQTKKLILLLGDGNGFFEERLVHSFNSSSPKALAISDFNRDSYLDMVVINDGYPNVAYFKGTNKNDFLSPIMYNTESGKRVSVRVNDLDNNGLVDVAIASFDMNRIDILNGIEKLFLPYIEVNFEDFPGNLVSGYFNDDPYLDFATVYVSTNLTSISFGFGNGTFGKAKVYDTGALPTSIAAADVNNDSHIDFIVSSSVDRCIIILFGNGLGDFTQKIRIPTSLNPERIAVDDFNNDQNIDLAIVYTEQNSIGIRLGYGDGTFHEESLLETMTSPTEIVTADFNNDEHSDIAVTCSDSNVFCVFMGSGNGKFSNRTEYETGMKPLALCTADLNNDGHLDIIVTNEMSRELTVHLGLGNGRFMDSISQPTGFRPTYIATIDFHADEVIDVIVSHKYNNKLAVLLGRGDGYFINNLNYSTGSGPFNLLVDDFNMDNQDDVIISNFGDVTVNVFLHWHDEIFTSGSRVSSSVTSGLNFMVASDMNTINLSDLIITSYGEQNLGILLSRTSGEFSTDWIPVDNDYLNMVAVGDFNGDQQPDLVAISPISNTTIIFLNDGNKTFHYQVKFGSIFTTTPSAITTYDFDFDNKSELVLTQMNSEEIHILSSYLVTNLKRNNKKIPISTPFGILLNDFDDDGILDLIATSYSSDFMAIYIGRGDGTFHDPTLYATGKGTSICVMGHIDNDDYIDVATSNDKSNTISIFFGNTNGTFDEAVTMRTGKTPYSVAIGDINNDNWSDILVANFDESSLSMFLGTGSRQFLEEIRINIGDTPNMVKVTDINKDGNNDIVLTRDITSDIVILLGNGDGSFGEDTSYAVGGISYSFEVVDINQDNLLDIVVANYDGRTLNILLGSDDGSFIYHSNISVGLLPAYIVITDMNHDGLEDIVVCSQSDNTISILFGYGDGFFDTKHSFQTSTRSATLAIGDVNGDHELDIIVTCYWDDSLEFFFGASEYVLRVTSTLQTEVRSATHMIAIADFNKDYKSDIIIGYIEANLIGIFYNEGNYSFSKEYIYSMSNSSVISSMVVADFDNDTNIDILVTNVATHSLDIYYGQINTTFPFMQRLSIPTGTGSYPHSALAYDFDNDGILDISYINNIMNTVDVLLGDGKGGFHKKVIATIPFGSRPSRTAIGDFNGDGRLDIAVLNNATDRINVFLQRC